MVLIVQHNSEYIVAKEVHSVSNECILSLTLHIYYAISTSLALIFFLDSTLMTDTSILVQV